jgi:hypothetical protein
MAQGLLSRNALAGIGDGGFSRQRCRRSSSRRPDRCMSGALTPRDDLSRDEVYTVKPYLAECASRLLMVRRWPNCERTGALLSGL